MNSPHSVPAEMILTGDNDTQMVLVTSLPNHSIPQIVESSQIVEAQVMDSNRDFPNENTINEATPELVDKAENANYVNKSEVQSNSTILDINQFMEVVYSYKCKFCDFATKLADDMSNHVLNVHIEKQPLARNEATEACDMNKHDSIKTELIDHVYNAAVGQDKASETQIIEEEGTVDASSILETSSLGLVTSIHGETTPPVQHSVANSESVCQEIFMCGQCTLGFSSIEQCKQHMCDEHNITLLTELDAEQVVANESAQDIAATVKDPNSDKVSIATQVMILKKPGRKRKQPEKSDSDHEVQNKDDTELKLDFKDEQMDDTAELPIFSEEFLSEREREGKRRIKIPKSLQHDYYVPNSRDNRKPPLSSLPKRHLPSELKKDLNESYNIKCKVIGCKAKFQTETSLEEHLRCHNKADNGEISKGFTCSHCSFTSIQWNQVRLHLWTKHKINLDLLSCDKCQYHTDAIHKLEIHRQIHEEERNYPCDVCDKSFKQLTQLMHHSSLHKTSKDRSESRATSCQNHQCHICNKIMADSKSLKNHIRYVHEKIRCFSCKFCGHTAARKHMLQVHMRTHTGERPHKCDLCSFATSDHNTLRRHRLRHTGEKPYKCRYCPYACIQAISLKVHMKNKHQHCEGLYYCQICHYHTVSEKNWLQHQEDHNNGLIDEHSQKNTQNSYNKKQKLPVTEPKPVAEFVGGTENTAEELNLYKANSCDAEVEQMSNITEIIQSSSGETNVGSMPNVQYVYYTFDENGDKEELVISKGLLAAEGENDVAPTKPAYQTVQITQGGEGSTLSFTLQPTAEGEQQLILAPVTQDRQSLLGMKSAGIELIGSAIGSVKLANQ